MVPNGHEVSFRGDKRILKLDCGDVAQLCKHITSIKLHTLNGLMYDMWIISPLSYRIA